uniref:Trypsin family protein n=1 Tax=Kalanchoe fedtschenkoi TaxID=63787 RepID=A0A7N0U1X0_KALFE
MDRSTFNLRFHQSGSAQSEESALDMETNGCNHLNLQISSSPPLQVFASCGQLSESNTAYFSWPTSSRLQATTEDRANYFGNLQKGVLPEVVGRLPTGQRATTLLELMTIRAFHSKILRRFSLGTAIGFRIRKGVLTDIPAILVFVSRKVHRQWLCHIQCLPVALEGPGGVWCDVDVVEFAYFGAPASTPKEQLYTELADGLRGGDPTIACGSQVASQETYGTLGAIVRSRTGNRQVGFLTNRHVAVDLDYPNQKMFHPMPPSLGPGVYLGAVERATSFITDDLWYGIFAGTNPETFVRADGAFIPFAEDFDISNVSTYVKGVGEIGEVNTIDLQCPINGLIGRQVIKVGRSSGLTAGTIMAYALEYNDEKGICFFTDFLVVGENQQTFDLEGDSGSLILLTGENGEMPRPVGIIWGGTANRGRLKLKVGQPPENWTSGVDLGRLLDLLELDLITSNEGLQDAVREQRAFSGAGIDSTVGESSTPIQIFTKDKIERNPILPHSFNLPLSPCNYEVKGLTPTLVEVRHIENDERSEAAQNVEHQFLPICLSRSPLNKRNQSKSLSALRSDFHEEISVSLHLGEPETKRKKLSSSPIKEERK